METPLHVQQGQVITGELRLAAHNRQSYDVFVDLAAPPLHPGQLPQKVLPSTPCAIQLQQATPPPLVHSCTHPMTSSLNGLLIYSPSGSLSYLLTDSECI